MQDVFHNEADVLRSYSFFTDLLVNNALRHFLVETGLTPIHEHRIYPQQT
jgi:hypothetical protein